MRSLFFIAITAAILFGCKDSQTETAAEPMVKETTTAPQWEPGSTKYSEMGKQQLKAFENGDIDQWSTMFADNAVYAWSSGDSLSGKQAITDYWKKRRTEVIDKISFSNDIWLPVVVNQPQQGPDMPGNWLLNWYQVDVTYKNGKQLSFWVHTDFHFNANDKVDRVVQYIDRAPINAAVGGK